MSVFMFVSHVFTGPSTLSTHARVKSTHCSEIKRGIVAQHVFGSSLRQQALIHGFSRWISWWNTWTWHEMTIMFYIYIFIYLFMWYIYIWYIYIWYIYIWYIYIYDMYIYYIYIFTYIYDIYICIDLWYLDMFGLSWFNSLPAFTVLHPTSTKATKVPRQERSSWRGIWDIVLVEWGIPMDSLILCNSHEKHDKPLDDSIMIVPLPVRQFRLEFEIVTYRVITWRSAILNHRLGELLDLNGPTFVAFGIWNKLLNQ